SSTASISGLPRETTLPTTNTSAPRAMPCNCSEPNPSVSAMPNDCNCVDIGGYTFASQPVTRWPAACAIAAIPPMNVPQMPRICRCMSKRDQTLFGEGANIRGFECARVDGRVGQPGTRQRMADRFSLRRSKCMVGREADRDLDVVPIGIGDKLVQPGVRENVRR